jgi:pimeloyl-ACP methyl ester carboxylesterase
VVVVHGKLRNADRYFQTMQRAASSAGVSESATLIALDSLLAQLSDRTRFPNLKEVVFAGHSGGGQVIQRYAVASKGVALQEAGAKPLTIRYLVANPSSYAYFDDERPVDNATDSTPPRFARYGGSPCAGFDEWKYGMQNRPPYLAERDSKALEEAYVKRDVTYLIGGADDNPAQAALDKSCPAEVQGPQRLVRARNYYAYLQMRHPSAFSQRFYTVPGVGHNESKMLTSVCALHVMFGAPGCDQ